MSKKKVLLVLVLLVFLSSYGFAGCWINSEILPGNLAFTKRWINNWTELVQRYGLVQLAKALNPNAAAFNNPALPQNQADVPGVDINADQNAAHEQLPANIQFRERFILDGNTYYIPVDTALVFNSPSRFDNRCIDGAIGPVSDPNLIIGVTRPDGIFEYVNNIFCLGPPPLWHHCLGGQVCMGRGFDNVTANPAVYHFLQDGLYDVNVGFLPENSSEVAKWTLIEEFNVIAVNPLIAVNGSEDKILALKDSNSGETNIVWTIRNISNVDIKLMDVTPGGCGEADTNRENLFAGDVNQLSCSLSGYTQDLLVSPKQTVLIKEKIEVSHIPELPIVKNLFLQIKYSDANDLMEKEMQSEKVKLTIANDHFEKFNLQLFGGKQDYCMGPNGEIGQTGEEAVPKVKFSWKWGSPSLSRSRDIEEIAINECDTLFRGDSNFTYCDATQFSIELLQKLAEIEARLNKGYNINEKEIMELRQFQANLIMDNYSQAFRSDFDSKMRRTQFYGTPQSYSDIRIGFWKYFTRPSLMDFKVRLEEGQPAPQRSTELETGLYDVKIDFVFPQGQDINADQNTGRGTEHVESLFTSTGETTAIITVNLSKVRDPYAKNPFYYIPFDGEIGVEEGSNRLDYGARFDGNILLAEYSAAGSGYSTVARRNGLKEIKVSTISDIWQTTTGDSRGVVLEASANKIKFAPSLATPVIFETTAYNKRADVYYYLSKGQDPLVALQPYRALWTAIGSNISNCKDFLDHSPYYRRADSRATAKKNCIQSGRDRNSSYGIEWVGVAAEKNGQKMYLQTVFFMPRTETVSLYNACADSSHVIIPASGATRGDSSVGLAYGRETALDPTSVKKAFSMIKSGYLCSYGTEDKYLVFWNAERVARDQIARATAAGTINNSMLCTGKIG